MPPGATVRLALRCRCGSLAHYCGRHTQRFICSLGELNLTRAYLHCAACRCEFRPQDHMLGLTERSLYPGVVRMIGQSPVRANFAESRQLLWELAQVAVSVKQVEPTDENLGRQIAADESAVIEAEPKFAATFYLGIDETGIPMRASETAGRKGKPEASVRRGPGLGRSSWSRSGVPGASMIGVFRSLTPGR